MDWAIFSSDGLYQIFRWLHFLAGIVWIGILYYFNFVQGEFFKETDANTKTAAVQKLVPRALWWFRWGAMFTFLSGVVMLYLKGHQAGPEIYGTSWGILILTGGLLGTLMFLNVWLIIWPAQKIVIAKAKGESVNGDPAAAGARAALASRTNTLFSIPMLFFMAGASHLPVSVDYEFSSGPMWGALFVIIGLLELNVIKGKVGPMASVAGVIHMGLLLTVVLYGVIEFFT